jgi:hypothetical protein
MLFQVVHEVRIGIQEVKSQALAFPLEQLALAIAQLVAPIRGVEAGVGLHIKYDQWNAALAHRSNQLLEGTHDALGAHHVPVFVWHCRIFIEVSGAAL